MEFIDDYLKDDLLGLRVGRHLNMHILGVIYEISLKATTIEEGLHYCHNYLETTFPQFEIKNIHGRDRIRMQIDLHNFPERICRIVLEATLTVMGRELTAMTGTNDNSLYFSIL